MEYWEQAWQPTEEGNSPLNRIFCALLLLAGTAALLAHYRFAFTGWFYREDSRYFSNGLFSLYDVVTSFLEPHNAMGHYRPITKLIWGIPEWLGLNDARVYHSLLVFALLLAAGFLMRLSFLLFGNPLLAIFAGLLWAFMPVNAKPLYWICAGQDTTAGLFALAALTFRIEQWRQPSRERMFRVLCLLSVFFAATSREAGLAGTMLIPLIDWRYRKLRRAWDVGFILSAVFFWVFILHPPFQRARVHLDILSMLSPQFLQDFWKYAQSTFWTLGDSHQDVYPAFASVITALALLIMAIGCFVHWALLLATLMALAGVTPFLLIHAFSIEYAFLFGAGAALAVTGLPAVLLRGGLRKPAASAVLLLASLLTLGGYYQYLRQSREIFNWNYTERSHLLRNFLEELAAYSRTLPPYQPVELASLGPYKDSEARDSHHFIPMGLDELVPDRVFLIEPSILDSGEGTQLRNPKSWLWTRSFAKAAPSIRIRYTEQGFVRD